MSGISEEESHDAVSVIARFAGGSLAVGQSFRSHTPHSRGSASSAARNFPSASPTISLPSVELVAPPSLSCVKDSSSPRHCLPICTYRSTPNVNLLLHVILFRMV